MRYFLIPIEEKFTEFVKIQSKVAQSPIPSLVNLAGRGGIDYTPNKAFTSSKKIIAKSGSNQMQNIVTEQILEDL